MDKVVSARCRCVGVAGHGWSDLSDLWWQWGRRRQKGMTTGEQLRTPEEIHCASVPKGPGPHRGMP